MKFRDMIEFSFFYIKKHKLRFFLNTITIIIIMTLIFILFSLCSSIYSTINNDLNNYLRQNDNNIIVILNGTHNDRKENSVELNEIGKTKEILSKYGNVEVKENIRYNELKLYIQEENIPMIANIIGYNTPQIIEGEEWNKDKENKNYLWITNDIFQMLKSFQSDFGIESEIEVGVNNNIEKLILKGIVEGKGSIFADKSYLIDNNFVYINYAEFYINLYNENIAKYIKNLYKELNFLNNNFVNDNETARLTNYEISHFMEISNKANLYIVCIVCVIIFLSILIVGVLKNNSIINIYDNIESFSIMRCLGMKNSIITFISLMETYLNIIISSLISGGLALTFRKPIKSFANKLLTKDLIISSTASYSSAQWLFFVFTIVLIFISTLYFLLTLTKSLKRKNLIRTLKGE